MILQTVPPVVSGLGDVILTASHAVAAVHQTGVLS
uniref:Uncharacterized protein n=1 Tax=Anguilla anguilla TaxID=7936 RepID=A0A0E9S3H8_ANGAN